MKFLLLPVLLLVLLLHSYDGNAQRYKVSGIVMDHKKEALALASVEVAELKTGLITREDGSYEFLLERGQYTIVASMIGFKTKLVTVQVTSEDIIEHITMEEEAAELSEVVIRAKLKDRSEDVIKSVIRNKDNIISAPGSYSVNVYIKASQQDSVDKKRKSKTDSTETEVDYGELSLSEISLRLDKSGNGQMKEERLGVKKNGKTENLFYLSTTEADFTIYNNLLKSPALSTIPFVSPISYSGLVAYRFKTLKIDRIGKRRIYTISVQPRLLSNATVEGELVIDDSLHVVLDAKFRLPVIHLTK